MQQLLIIGAGGSSREIASAVADINDAEPTFSLLGYLDDDASKRGARLAGAEVLGPLDRVAEFVDAQLIIGVAGWRNPLVREAIVERLAALGVTAERYATVVHPSASVSRFSSVGRGSALLPGVVVTPDTHIGDHVVICQGAILSHDCVVEDYATLSPGAVLSGGINVGRGAYIGAGSALMPGVRVGAGAVVGIGATLVARVPAGKTVVGWFARSGFPGAKSNAARHGSAGDDSASDGSASDAGASDDDEGTP